MDGSLGLVEYRAPYGANKNNDFQGTIFEFVNGQIPAWRSKNGFSAQKWAIGAAPRPAVLRGKNKDIIF